MMFKLSDKGYTVTTVGNEGQGPMPSTLYGTTEVAGVPSEFYVAINEQDAAFICTVDPIGGKYDQDAMVYRFEDGRVLDYEPWMDAVLDLERDVERLLGEIRDAMEELAGELVRQHFA